MWYDDAVFYQLYPLGACGAPWVNDGVRESRILKLIDWIPHIRALGCGAVYLNPVFESDAHGYDTRDYRALDCRLGTNADLRAVVDAFHDAGLRVVLDGVFNHVGRGFWAFRDVQEKRWDSPYRDWFNLSFDGNSNYNDGFWYEGWEGHYELVKLNLRNPAVADYILDTVKFWADEFGIDGLRLDVAYCLDTDFLARLRGFCDTLRPDFFLVGETLHGDYNRWLASLHSVTNYECYKGLYSSLNDLNLFEIGHSIKRQSGSEPWALYRGRKLFNFLDNHDVTRIASIPRDKRELPVAYGLLMAMPGIPCVYYGSEWGLEGEKKDGDASLRPALEGPERSELTELVAALIAARNKSRALREGGYAEVLLTNRQYIFQREAGGERVLCAFNADSEPYTAHFNAGCGRAVDLVSGAEHDFGGGSVLPPYSVSYWLCER